MGSRVCTHRARFDFQVPFNSARQQEQLSLGAPPSLRTHSKSGRRVIGQQGPSVEKNFFSAQCVILFGINGHKNTYKIHIF